MATNQYYSCVVDSSPVFYWQTWGLVNSLVKAADVPPKNIFVHHTPEVDEYFIEELLCLGVKTIPIQRFGDGKYCNKIVQLDTCELWAAECIVLMDTDMIVLGSLAELYAPNAILGKIADFAIPDISALKNIFDAAGFQQYPPICDVDCGKGQTFQNQLSGGLYVIPRDLAPRLGKYWKKWASWLLEHMDMLTGLEQECRIDQIAFALATHDLSIPIQHIDRKYNYPIHLPIDKTGYPAVLHYHGNLSKVGLVKVEGQCDADFQRAIAAANQLIGDAFNNRIFWPFRYAAFPELGSGIGSRGQNLEYKRRLLQESGIEESTSVLDVGCGDIETIRTFTLSNYTGIDISPNAISIAKSKRPELNFILFTGEDDPTIPCADTVLCLELLIHQKSIEEYRKIISFLAAKTKRRLIVSGYTSKQPHHDSNHMLAYHESLFDSLEKTGKFAKIHKIGSHSDVDIIMAEV